MQSPIWIGILGWPAYRISGTGSITRTLLQGLHNIQNKVSFLVAHPPLLLLRNIFYQVWLSPHFQWKMPPFVLGYSLLMKCYLPNVMCFFISTPCFPLVGELFLDPSPFFMMCFL